MKALPVDGLGQYSGASREQLLDAQRRVQARMDRDKREMDLIERLIQLKPRPMTLDQIERATWLQGETDMTTITRPQDMEEFLFSGDKRNMYAMAYGGRSTDALDQPDTISLEELYTLEEGSDASTEMSRAGIDETTAVDTFMVMQGETRYVTEI